MAEALNLGEQVKVKWNPGRLLVIEYCGDDRFEVMESVNSKLSVGDTFVCHQLVADEPKKHTHTAKMKSKPIDDEEEDEYEDEEDDEEEKGGFFGKLFGKKKKNIDFDDDDFDDEE